jgi:hypothetical protein
MVYRQVLEALAVEKRLDRIETQLDVLMGRQH